MLGTLITSPIRTPNSRRGWTTRSVSRKLWPSLSSAPSTTLTSMLRMSVSSLKPVINCNTTSHLPFGSILFHVLHPLFDIICSGEGLCYLHHSAGISWPPCLSSLFHNCFCNVSAIFLYGIYGCLYLSCPMSPTDGACQAESYVPGISQGSPPLCDPHPKNRIACPWARTTALLICSLRPSWNISAINEPLHAWEGRADHLLLPPKSLSCGCNSTSDLHVWGDLVNAQTLGIIPRVISCIS